MFLFLKLGACTFVAICVAQAQNEKGPKFEVASIKAAQTGSAISNRGGPGTTSPGQWVGTNVSLLSLLTLGWGLDPHLVLDPTSLNVRYDIAAKIPPQTSRTDFLLMIRQLLIDRLQLQVHFEPVVREVYELRIAKSGLKLKEATLEAEERDVQPAGPIRPDKDGNPQLPPGKPSAVRLEIAGVVIYAGRVQSVAEIIHELEQPLRRVILDKTGLGGRYDYILRYAWGDSLEAPPLPSAMEQQLGLQISPVKAAVPMLRVDHFLETLTQN